MWLACKIVTVAFIDSVSENSAKLEAERRRTWRPRVGGLVIFTYLTKYMHSGKDVLAYSVMPA